MSEITAIAHPGIDADAVETACRLLGQRDHASILVQKARAFVATTGATFTVTKSTIDDLISGRKASGRQIVVGPDWKFPPQPWDVADVVEPETTVDDIPTLTVTARLTEDELHE